jgi:hypothetical protein
MTENDKLEALRKKQEQIKVRIGRRARKLDVKDWVTVVNTERQAKMVTFLLWSYGFLIVSTMLIFFLEGFHFDGFNIDVGLLKWLGGATIGEIGGLLVISFRACFRR